MRVEGLQEGRWDVWAPRPSLQPVPVWLSQQDQSTMDRGNHTASEFILLGLSSWPERQELVFGLFLVMYLVGAAGNLLIILAVGSDSHLHMPLYFFLSNLSLVDFCFLSATVPKMLVNIQAQTQSISYGG